MSILQLPNAVPDQVTHQCQFNAQDKEPGEPVKKPSLFRGSILLNQSIKLCDNSHKHKHLQGKYKDGTSRTHHAQAYPHQFAMALAKDCVRWINNKLRGNETNINNTAWGDGRAQSLTQPLASSLAQSQDSNTTLNDQLNITKQTNQQHNPATERQTIESYEIFAGDTSSESSSSSSSERGPPPLPPEPSNQSLNPTAASSKQPPKPTTSSSTDIVPIPNDALQPQPKPNPKAKTRAKTSITSALQKGRQRTHRYWKKSTSSWMDSFFEQLLRLEPVALST